MVPILTDSDVSWSFEEFGGTSDLFYMPIGSVVERSSSASAVFTLGVSTARVVSPHYTTFTQDFAVVGSLRASSSTFGTLVSAASSGLQDYFSVYSEVYSSPSRAVMVLMGLKSTIVPTMVLSVLCPQQLGDPRVLLGAPRLLSADDRGA